MAQEFRYPNLVAGTDAWTDWFEPETNVKNATASLYVVTFPRKLEVGDVVCASMDVQFDGLVLGTKYSGDFYNFRIQGTADHSWRLSNAVAFALQAIGDKLADGTYDGLKTFCGTYAVTSGDSAVGTSRDDLSVRLDNCGGGASARGGSWSRSTGTASRTRGRLRRGRCGLK